jgi:hypothetical protein
LTVGVPEISLDTWGLKYVKKKGAGSSIQAGNLAHDTPSQKIEEEVSSHGGRQSDSVADPKGQKIEHPAETDPFRMVEGIGRKDSETTTGRREGATSTIGSEDTVREEHGQKHLTSEGKILEGQGNPKRKLGVGESASQTSGIQSPETQTIGRETRGGKGKPSPTGLTAQGKPVKGGKEGKTHGALPKVKAEMELAIIKCKLLKMNNINKILPLLAAGSAIAGGAKAVSDSVSDSGEDDVEKTHNLEHAKEDIDEHIKEMKKSEHRCVSCGQKVPKEKKGVEEYSANEKHQVDNPASSYSHYKSNDEVVSKAIELINEAYDEMKSSSFKKLKPVYEGDTKEAKKVDADQGQDLSGTKVEEDRAKKDKEIGDLAREKQKDAPATTSDVGAANFVYSDVAEAKKNEDWFEDKPSKKDQKKQGKHYKDWYKDEITDQK